MIHRIKRHYAISTLVIILGVSALFYINSGCGSEPTSGGASTPSSKGQPGQIYGVVLDTTSGNGVPGATVSIGGKTTTTKPLGDFSLSDISPSNNVLINVSADHYTPTQHVINLTSGNTVQVIAYIKGIGNTTQFSASSGGTVSDATGGQITISSGTYEGQSGTAYTGNVSVEITSFDLSITPEFSSFPGNFAGRTGPTGSDKPFSAYGYINISVTDPDGNTLNLKSGTTAEVRIPIPASFQSDAPDTIQLWKYIESGGYWQNTGIATKEPVLGTYYTAVLTHLCWLCCGGILDIGYLSGKVVDGIGQPVANAYVFAKSSYYLASGITDSNGNFTKLVVEASCPKEVWAQKGSKVSGKLIVDPYPAFGDTYTLPSNLILTGETFATITMSWKVMPFHLPPYPPYLLDAHFTGPTSEGGGVSGSRFHMTPSNPSPANSDATIETTGNPQIINISSWHPGTYRFSCENKTMVTIHSTLEGGPDTIYFTNMNTSEAIVVFSRMGGTITNTYNIPTSNSDNKLVWKVFEISVEASGDISGITELNTYGTTNEAAPEPYLYP